MKLEQSIAAAVQSPKLAAIFGTISTVTGIGTVINQIPAVLGIIATVSGIALTWVMIIKGLYESKKIKQSWEEREREIEARREKGDPCRRHDE